jgi:hypothetical protein
MSIISSEQYRAAFSDYLRRGTPIRLSRKDTGPTGQYVWRTRRDAKVRQSHRVNDGRRFDWSDPPDTGHPGAEINCRCEAVPYVRGETEFAFHVMKEFPSEPPYRYGDLDFVSHYYYGEGRTLTLSEIGHLREIAEYYAYSAGGEGIFRKLSDQIVDAVRKASAGQVVYPFRNTYDFGSIEFSHGSGSVSGVFDGTSSRLGTILQISGETTFAFSDRFEDPVDLRIEVGGTPYQITGEWSATFSAEVFVDRTESIYNKDNLP